MMTRIYVYSDTSGVTIHPREDIDLVRFSTPETTALSIRANQRAVIRLERGIYRILSDSNVVVSGVEVDTVKDPPPNPTLRSRVSVIYPDSDLAATTEQVRNFLTSKSLQDV